MFENELKQLGLSDKEARVYLALLELGPSSILQISQKSGINRPTTYVQIEALMRFGLVSSYTKGKKRFFTAEPPQRLDDLVRAKQKDLDTQSEQLRKILPDLAMLFNMVEERPKVRFYEGKEGILAIHIDIFKVKNKEILTFYPFDLYEQLFTKQEREEFEAIRRKKRITGRALYTRKSGQFPEPPPPTIQDRFVPEDRFPFSANIDIYDNKIASHSLKGKLVGVIIESKDIADMMRSIFELAWETAEKYQR